MIHNETLHNNSPLIRNLFIDFGGILVNLNRPRAIQAFRTLGMDVTPFIDDCHQGGPFAGMEDGSFTPQQFCEQLRLATGQPSVSDDAILSAWNTLLVEVPEERLNFLLELRKHYRVFLLSNTNAPHWKYSVEHLFTVQGKQVDDYFERIFLSFELGVCKPDVAFFHKVLQATGVNPQQTLFVDDALSNCKAAQQTGLQVLCPVPVNQWMNQLVILLDAAAAVNIEGGEQR